MHEVFISFSFTDQEIVDKVVNHLTNLYGISCWICTEEIRAGENFRKDIAKAIREAALVVLVQSKHSAASQEVSKEVLFALKKGKMVKPFVIEESELEDEMELELSTTHYIDATYPELEDRIKELARDICKSLGKPFAPKMAETVERKEALVSTPSVIPKRVFCGRQDTLEEIHHRFQDGERVVFLHGIGGIGKTQIAKQYAKQYRDQYDVIVYATYDGSLQQLIIGDSPFVIEPEVKRLTTSDGSVEGDQAYFQRKLDRIKKLSNERTLIILDNFDVDHDPDLPLVTEGRYHLLITSRCDYSRWFSTVPVREIQSPEALKQVFFQNYSGFDVWPEDPALPELFALVNNHTYTIELLAQHMENSGQSVAEMIHGLKQEGILSIHEKVMGDEMKTQVAYENLLKMFRLFSLTPEERKILMYLSMMPLEGVDVHDFRVWAGLTSNHVLCVLERKSWIIKNAEGIALHPIIRDVVKHECPITEERCGEFLRRFTKTIDQGTTWQMSRAKKERYAAIARSVLIHFPEVTEVTYDLYMNAQALFAYSVDPQRAEILISQLWEYHCRVHGEKSYWTGRIAYKRGWLYAFNLQLTDALPQARLWLERAKEILDGVEIETYTEKFVYIQAVSNLSKAYVLSYAQTEDPEFYSRAVQVTEQILEYAEKHFPPSDPRHDTVSICHWQMSDVLCLAKKYDQALEHSDIALRLLVERYTAHSSDATAAMYRKACVLYAMKAYEEAKDLAEQSVAGYADFFGESHVKYCQAQSLLGDCYMQLGDSLGAVASYKKAWEAAKGIFAPGAKQLEEMENKLRGLMAE